MHRKVFFTFLIATFLQLPEDELVLIVHNLQEYSISVMLNIPYNIPYVYGLYYISNFQEIICP